MSMHRRAFIALAWLAAASHASPQAGIVLNGTRIVFAGERNEAFIGLGNRGEQAGLVQLWLEGPQQPAADGPAQAPSKAPFVLTPSVFRLEPGKTQMVRIVYAGAPLPAGQETLFWLNVQEIPPKAQDAAPGSLRFAARMRIKLMYRPPGLPGNADLAPARLRWSLVTGADGTPALQAANPTAHVVNLGSVDLRAGGRNFEAGSGHVLPGETASFPVRGRDGASAAGATVVFSSLDDRGAATRHEAPLSP